MAGLKSLLVIGGSGFFGKSILDDFTQDKLSKYGVNEVIVFSRNAKRLYHTHPELINGKVHLMEGDIALVSELPGANYVIHAASSSNERNYLDNPQQEYDNIVNAATNYAALAPRFHANSKILYCSSGAVYGKQPVDIPKLDEEFPFQDLKDMPPAKRVYAEAKRESERIFRKLGNDGLQVSIARCFAFYGKYLPRDQHFAYGNFLGQAERGEDIVVNATHPVIRSYMEATDMVSSLMVLLKHASPECPIVNVGSDEAIEIRELAKRIAKEKDVKCITNAMFNQSKIDTYVPDIVLLKNLISKTKNF